ncbi:MAG: LysE family translocator [Chloroflexota bacterium]|nr:LysE family translocator [Chloroflexota bacterium]
MPEPTTLLLFAGAALALLVVPGPSVVYIVTRGVHQGPAAALVSVLGVTTATLVHTVFAAAGLSAILASSALAFSVVKYAGSAYLVYLAIRTWLDRSGEALDIPRPAADLRRVYVEGFLVNLLNPKTALFILALLPQFVDPARGAAAVQILVLGGMLASLGLLSDGAYALASGSIGSWLRRRRSIASIQRRVSAAIYAILGIGTALAGQRTQ